MAAHSSNLAWRVPWTEEPGRLQSVGLQESGLTEQLSLTPIYTHIHIDISFSIIEDNLADLCSYKINL